MTVRDRVRSPSSKNQWKTPGGNNLYAGLKVVMSSLVAIGSHYGMELGSGT